VEEVTDEPLYRDRVCGIDIGKAGMVATIRVPSDGNPARRMAETRIFGTTKREVLALADWLRSWQVPALVMEATGWLAACFERGAVRPYFVATPEFRIIRLHTRYRRDWPRSGPGRRTGRRSCWNRRRSSFPASSPTCTASPAGTSWST
jgi:transposase